MPPSYVSPLRAAQAAATRRRILEAAASAFSSSGYAGASLAQIAEAAGVSVETVKQNGPKSALLLACFDLAFAGEEGDGPLYQREGLAELRAKPRAELLPGLIAFIATANSHVVRLWPRLVEASMMDADVAARLDALQQSRRVDMLGAITVLRDAGLCVSTAPDEDLAAQLSFLLSPEGYAQLVLESGWSTAQYQRWLATAIERMLLTD